MQDNPLVSIVICFFNAERYFQETLDSVLEQRYENWELLLVDDGSTDGSTDLAKEYASAYPERVRYLQHGQHQRRGTSASRNLGFAKAKGDYIALLDADDVWLPEKLERQVAILNARPEAAMVYGATLMWFSWNSKTKDWYRPLGVQPDTLVQPPTLMRLFLEGKASTPGVCAVLVRRSAVEAIAGFEDHFSGMYDDQVFIAKICLHYPVFVESGRWDKYRQHPTSLCHTAKRVGTYHPLRPNASRLNYLNWVELYLSELNLEGTATWQALQKALFPYRHPTLFLLLEPLLLLNQFTKRVLRKVKQYSKSFIDPTVAS